MMGTGIESQIFNVKGEDQFLKLALDIFRFQAEMNPVYKEFISKLHIDPHQVSTLSDIPFLPIELFKTHYVYSGKSEPEIVFESSGTTGMTKSRHYIARASLYEKSFSGSLDLFYGDCTDHCILALLPSYLERENSSLVYMMNHIISNNRHPDSGFYLNDLDHLSEVLKSRIEDGGPALLLGVSFALLELAEQFQFGMTDNIIVMETGGMKGKRNELTRQELHEVIINAFQIRSIHSEYGMTELLSQAYSKGAGLFYSPPWMKVLCRDTYDPRTLIKSGITGGINIIDLANIYSCSFIATSDLGKVHADGGFEVQGRYDQSDIRGCNLLIA